MDGTTGGTAVVDPRQHQLHNHTVNEARELGVDLFERWAARHMQIMALEIQQRFCAMVRIRYQQPGLWRGCRCCEAVAQGAHGHGGGGQHT